MTTPLTDLPLPSSNPPITNIATPSTSTNISNTPSNSISVSNPSTTNTSSSSPPHSPNFGRSRSRSLDTKQNEIPLSPVPLESEFVSRERSNSSDAVIKPFSREPSMRSQILQRSLLNKPISNSTESLYKKEVLRLRKELETNKKEFENSQQREIILEAELDQKTSDLFEMNKRYNLLNIELTKYKEKVQLMDRYKTTLENLNKRLQHSKEYIDSLEQELTESLEKNEIYEKEIANLQQELKKKISGMVE